MTEYQSSDQNDLDDYGQSQTYPQDVSESPLVDMDSAAGTTIPPGYGQSQELVELAAKAKGGANWFYWVAGLSLVNSIIILTGNQWAFIIGLGMTQVADFILSDLAQSIGAIAKVIAIVFDFVVVGIFVLFGVLANKRYIWAFILGMVIYAFDGLIFLLVQDWLSIGFHVFVLIMLYNGLQATMQINRLEMDRYLQGASGL